MFLVHRWMGPIPGLIRTSVGIKGIVTGFFQYLGNLKALLDIAAPFLEFLSG